MKASKRDYWRVLSWGSQKGQWSRGGGKKDRGLDSYLVY